MKNAMKKLLSLALALVLLVGVFPMTTFAAENEDDGVAAASFLDSTVVQNLLKDCEHKDQILAELEKLELSAQEIVNYILKRIEELKNSGNNESETPNDGKEEVTPPAEEDKPAADTYDIYLNVYEIKDNTAKQWDGWNQGRDPEAMTKSEMTLSELMAYVGYGSYESVYAQVNGARYESRVPITLKDGMQIDLFVTPSKGGDKNDKPSTGTDTNKPGTDANKPGTDTNKPGTDTTKPGKGEKVTLRVFHNDGTSNYTDIRCYTTDSLLDVINANDELSELSRDGYKLIGWAFEANNDYNQEWIAAQHKVSDDDDLRVYADWQETKPGKDDKPSKPGNDDDDDGEDEVLLKIYVNGNTKSAAKVVDMDAYDNDGKITLAEATKVVKKYYEQASDNDDMDIDGLFTYRTWNGGDYSMKNAKKSITVNEKGDTIIYVMVRDAQKISSGTADSTNPKTGDTIFMAVTVMALSATALAVVYFFNKKRAVK